MKLSLTARLLLAGTLVLTAFLGVTGLILDHAFRDYAGVTEFMKTQGVIQPALQEELGRLRRGGIPVDIIFEQGPEVVLGTTTP